MKKKVLSFFLALSLALGVSLPSVTPVMAGVTYNPNEVIRSIAAGGSYSFNLTMTGLEGGTTYPLLYVPSTGNKLPMGWINAPSSFSTLPGATTYTIPITINVPIDADLLTFTAAIKYQSSASGCKLVITVTPPVIDHIVISPDTATVTAGGGQTYTATAYSDGYNWDITSSTIFSIEGGAGGGWSANVYTSDNAGTWTVTGSYSGKTDTAILTV
ncbi:MAG: hypothetical protein ABH934_02770, partial [Chloroflexota bacterium]